MADPLSSVSTSSSSSATSGNRMFGLASGLDIDSMVDKLMQAERVPLTQLEQQKQLLQWQQDDYRDMNSLLLDLRTSTFNMTLQSSYLSRTATSNDESKITAVASANSPKTSYTISNATLATAANAQSGKIGSDNDDNTADIPYDATLSVWAMRDALNLSDGTDGQYQIKDVTGEETDVDKDGTLFQLKNTLIDDTKTTSVNVNGMDYDVFYNQDDFNNSDSENKVWIEPDSGLMMFNNTLKKGDKITTDYSYGEFADGALKSTISTPDADGNMQDHDISFAPTDTMDQMISKINNSGANITAFYDDASQKISIVSNVTGTYTSGEGEDKDITFDGDFLTNSLKLTTDGVANGTDANVTINGLATTRHTNTFTINGSTFTLKDKIDAPVTVTVADDTNGIYDKIKDWVDKYNDTIAKINDKLGEERYRDYAPLTDEQESEMTDNQVELWTDKAKSGMLSQDTILSSGLTKMRQDLYSSVGGVDSAFDQLAEIGITTSSNYQDKGKLVISETDLKAAIASNPEAVMDIFTHSSDDYSDQGIMKRLTDSLDKTMADVTQKAGKATSTYDQFALGKSIHDYEDKIDDMQDRLSDLQTRYYNQFSAMEQAIEQANQQSGYLTSMLGG
ncbi:flagellar hook-associated protein 2 [Pullulanibacillus pueri]|uniref:Flagellar hook-associated protein 2 n=1 Tax=Pullulanibacillus pueri TaxID=1437324 RepID=A0A8J3EPQ5_9BACL|nr:flagellar hook-associated protein 2 [Pullulanibacillus pueri]MBM7684161.1 flagellar hook-associated protein 2 [Pullulanibacillus pueri]GGH88860.1 hypothetical protein GCM10007096_42150 [Pullulanibacillus pueri]